MLIEMLEFSPVVVQISTQFNTHAVLKKHIDKIKFLKRAPNFSLL